MTSILHESDADLAVLDGSTVAVVGYGNQGRSWAFNLRDSGLDVRVCVRADATREDAIADGFEAGDLDAASRRCHLRARARRRHPLAAVAAGADAGSSSPAATPSRSTASIRRATSGWWRPACSAPRCAAVTRKASGSSPASACITMSPAGPGPDAGDRHRHRRVAARRHRDDRGPGGHPRPRRGTSTVARVAPGVAVVRRGDDRTRHPPRSDPHRAVPFGRGRAHLSPVAHRGLRRPDGVPLADQSVRPAVESRPLRHLDVPTTMREIVEGIASGQFADEWDAERDGGYAEFERLKQAAAGPAIAAFEADLRRRLGETAAGS